jgi:nucleoside-triphosphatase THEP1
MIRKHELSDKWIKASVLGTTWAASEIVLGSFLHNLKIPFSSNFLTAIGIIILISSNYKWSEKGLFWRAGLICALMKSMSPSAVIFGPMIAIFSEALLMEFSIRILGGTIGGYLLGGMLAMTWNLFHRIMNLIIFYGSNIIDVYADIVKFSQKQLGIHHDILWMPVLVLVGLYCIMGIAAALIGVRVGKRLLNQPVEPIRAFPSFTEPESTNPKPAFPYSLSWLLLDVIAIITGLTLLTFTPWFIWSIFILSVVLIWITRYKRALRQLSKPRFWMGFVLITMLTAFTFNTMQSLPLMNGLLIGIQMNFRAVLIILGFSVIGTELYNPVIRAFFLKTSFRQLPVALELSFESLPAMIARIPDFKTLMKNPVGVVYDVLSGIDARLEDIRSDLPNKIIIISGHIGQGKTTQVQKLVETLRDECIPVAGIFSPRIMEDETTIGYDIIDAATFKREQFLRKSQEPGTEKIGQYKILPDGYQAGTEALKRSESKEYKVIVIDEIGQLELENKGWARNLDYLFNNSKSSLILAIRENFTANVIAKWNLKNYVIFNLSESDDPMIRKYLLQTLR